MDLWAEAKRLARYLAGKRTELERLELKDIVTAKAVLDIHRKKIGKEIVAVPLFSLRPIHLLDRENAAETARQRAETLRAHRQELLRRGTLDCETLARLMPSVSWIKVVKEREGSYLAFEGNGRIAALQSVFQLEDGLLVEAEEYKFRNPKKILRRLNRVRRLNGLLPEAKRGPKE
ncbi:MAG: hypothetical protein J7M29_10600 [Verrucomicrobia bacterium]|nr:hypothetical protein [Verrucomicrobiota bacterium]